jgi:hypothetical protein
MRAGRALGATATASARLATCLIVVATAFGGSPTSAADGDKAAEAATKTTPITVNAHAISTFHPAKPGERFGRLRFRGGLVLSSASPSFGGYSGIVLEPDGRAFVAISDAGTWLSGEITYEGGRPKSIAKTRIGPLVGLKGRQLGRKRDLDAEAMTLIDGSLRSGTLLIAFERSHRIGRFPVDGQVVGAPTSYLRLPPAARRMRSNGGFEAVAVLQSGPHRGAVVAFAERLLDARSNHTGWLWIDGEPRQVALTNIGDFDITDAVTLPDGSLIVLERWFQWSGGVKMRLRLVPAADIKPGALLDGEVLLEADVGYEIDNMEGMAVHRGPRGETVLTLISDNNFNNFLQRTLLLQFELGPAVRTQ